MVRLVLEARLSRLDLNFCRDYPSFIALWVGHSELAFSTGIFRIWHWSLVAWTCSCVQVNKWHWSCEGTTASVGEDFCRFGFLIVERGFEFSRQWETSSRMENCVLFLTLVRESQLNLPFWPRFFTKLNCVILVGLGYLPFLIKAVTLFLLIVRLFKCSSWLCPRQGVAYFIVVCLKFMGPFWGI